MQETPMTRSPFSAQATLPDIHPFESRQGRQPRLTASQNRGLAAWLVSAVVAIAMTACGGGDDDQATSAPTFEVATFVAPMSDLSEATPFNLAVDFERFENQTLRQIAHLSVGGRGVKFKFSNEYGTEPLTLDAVSVGRSLGLGTVATSTLKPITFAGKPTVTIAPGAQTMSDAVDMPIAPQTDLAVSIHLKSAQARTARRFGTTTTYVGSGDLTASAAMPSPKTTMSVYFMPQVVAIRDTKVNVFVAFGDSITEGGNATTDFYNSWPDQLSAAANAKFEIGVVNAGIGGNRWVRDNFGPCGVCRFERDVLNVPGVTHVAMALGINDLGLGYFYANALKKPDELVSAAQIIGAMKDAIGRAKAKGIKVYVATIVPYKGVYYYTSGQPNEIPFGATTPYNGEALRQEINAFIRTDPSIDAVLDFEAVVRDPVDPLKQRASVSADGLHPNDSGYGEFARLVDLKSLQ
jgi:lysophospholipase L1-like esterase